MADDYAGNSGTTGQVLNGSATGNLEATLDRDWFSISLTAGTTYSIALHGASTHAVTLADPFVYLYDSSGRELGSNDDGSGVNSLLTYTPVTDGTYYIAAGSYRDQGTGTYQLNVTSTAPRIDDEPTGNNTTTRSMTVGGTVVGGELEVAGDKDWFSVLLTPGTTYSFALSGAPSSAGTLPDPFVYLYDSFGRLLASNDDGVGVPSFDSLLAYTTQGIGTVPETYYVAARSFRDQGTGTYQLSVTSTPSVTQDEDSGRENAKPAGLGVTVNGTLEVAREADWYSVILAAGTAYSIELSGASSSQGTLVDPHVYLYDGNGDLIRSNDDGVGVARFDSLLAYTPQGAQGSSATYYVAARSYRDEGTGTYQLRVAATPIPADDEPTGGPGTQKTAAVGQPSTGELESAGDADWYQVVLIAGTTYNIQMKGATLADPYVYLYNTGGTLVASNDDSSGMGLNSLVEHRAEGTTGAQVIYYVAARSYRDQGTGTYELDVIAKTTAMAPSRAPATGFSTGAVTATKTSSGDNEGQRILVQDDGKVVVAGSNESFELVRYKSSGVLDISFGHEGKVSTAVGALSSNIVSATLQADGKIVVGASIGTDERSSFLVARYSASGSLDASFGTGGKAVFEDIGWDLQNIAIMNGLGGSDQLAGMGGNDLIDGGDGLDYAVFTGARSEYVVTVEGAAATVRDLKDGRDDADMLIDVERAKFADGYLAFDIAGNAGQAYRLYKAAFNRSPDLPGLGYQITDLDNGAAITQVAQNFIDSPEFSATYGTVDDNQFVTQLYANVLHRQPDDGGLAFHMANLAAGVPRSYVLVGFSESPENQAALIGVIGEGIVYSL